MPDPKNAVPRNTPRHHHSSTDAQAIRENAGRQLLEIARLEPKAALQKLETNSQGLHKTEAKKRLRTYGPNRLAETPKKQIIRRVLEIAKDPLSVLLIILAIVSFVTGDIKATIIIVVMVFLSASLRLAQELKADRAAEELETIVKTTATVIREGKKHEIHLQFLVPGDIVLLSAGDLVPADIRLVSSKDLFVNQATLTGESLPVEKHATLPSQEIQNPLELVNVCFMGTNIESGIGTGVVVQTGSKTAFGVIAEEITEKKTQTSFDIGINQYAWLMIRLIMILAPIVFFINGFTKGDWVEAFLFALSVVVGLTPEMLPMIVNVNLAKGASVMSEKKVIVKRLDAIQNFGAMDVLCTDKTGTLTQGKVILQKHIDIYGKEENKKVVQFAYLNSYYQTGLKNILDEAILTHVHLHSALNIDKDYKKVDEVTFDFERKRMSVIVQGPNQKHIIICKGAVEEVMDVCTHAEADEKRFPLDSSHRENAVRIVNQLGTQGFRVIAIAFKEIGLEQKVFHVEDEKGLILSGFIAFLDPPKDSAAQAIESLEKHGVTVKILTGDSELVTQTVCREVGIQADKVLLGEQIEQMSDAELAEAVDQTTIFARLSPEHKDRIVLALQKKGHVVGFMGDGINDAPALRVADVSISVDSAVDIAKESSSIILLEKSLSVLQVGVVEGRKVFGNIVKYIKMAASSSFGNMFSVIGASIFLPFLPMLPIQILINNLLYDFSQIAIPTDNVDKEWLEKPRKWTIKQIERFILLIGPISSIFDYTTYFMMLFVFNAWANPALFHTGWFVESLFTQTLIIHVIRTNKIPFLQSKASKTLLLSTLLICSIGAFLPYSPIAKDLGFVALPLLYWPLLALTVLVYFGLTQFVKTRLIRKYGED